MGLVVLSVLSHDLENETLVKFVDDPQLKGEGTADAVNGKTLLQRGLGKLEERFNRSLVEPPEVINSALAPGSAGAASRIYWCSMHSLGWEVVALSSPAEEDLQVVKDSTLNK